MPNPHLTVPGPGRSHRDRDHAPYAPARDILVPIASLALSLPTIVIGLLWVIAAATSAPLLLLGHSLSTGAPRSLMIPWPVCLWTLLGPITAGMLCVTQRTRAQERYGSALLLGYRIMRWNTLALQCAVVAMVLLPALGVVTIVLLALGPQ